MGHLSLPGAVEFGQNAPKDEAIRHKDPPGDRFDQPERARDIVDETVPVAVGDDAFASVNRDRKALAMRARTHSYMKSLDGL